jgi:hypothetical protein
MIEANVHRKGNAIELSILSKDVPNIDLSDNERIHITIFKPIKRPKSNPLQELAGSLNFNRSTRKILDDSRRGFSKWGL